MSGSPCGACKFLRRKCVRGCVFAPYFCHEQGPTHFAAIHKVFGASNIAKLLAQLPVSDRSEAATTISYEAQARVQDPIYGCVSHIFALQQQVVSLEAQLATLKQQTTNNNFINANYSTSNPNERYYGKSTSSSSNYPQDVQSWLQSEYPHMVPPFDHPKPDYCHAKSSTIYGDNHNHNNYSTMVQDNDHQNVSIGSYGESSSHNSIASLEFEFKSKWPFDEDTNNDLHSMAFGYAKHS
ncbi:hypothetical protein RND81_07G018600 [Saponaria officinalis]|uniref:LOB domain-containing protein n=1 Tax=Saponaria officinalis TaxID=3572 RepID=A0AAW1JLF6_SAPOF